ncbi:M90 family metallopeptidase [Fluviicola taffensis]|uniref:M90 family metallopeptidase n=1 Tax=Fluviicola taffensis TaxID=191579 RepID=UPI003137713A
MNSTTSIFLAIGITIGILIGYSRYSLKKNRSKKTPDRPFPHQWREILVQHVAFYNRLNPPKRTQFENRIHIFLLNVQIVGIDTEVTHLDRILIASGAIIPIFGFDSWHYSNLEVVEIHPDKFLIPNTQQYANGLVGWGAMEGRIKLSRKALAHGFYDTNDQKNVAIHEFVHVLDKQDGNIDGKLKKVMNEIDIMPWLQLINNKINHIHTGNSSIRKYGSTNHAEFLAVVSEFFFENPEKMKTEHPELYQTLDQFYNPKPKSKNLPKEQQKNPPKDPREVKSALMN